MTREAQARFETGLNWAVNVLAVTLLPAGIGASGHSVWAFLTYAAVAGATLTFVEDGGYFRTFWVRPDVRDYLRARIVLAALCGFLPYLAGSVGAQL